MSARLLALLLAASSAAAQQTSTYRVQITGPDSVLLGVTGVAYEAVCLTPTGRVAVAEVRRDSVVLGARYAWLWASCRRTKQAVINTTLPVPLAQGECWFASAQATTPVRWMGMPDLRPGGRSDALVTWCTYRGDTVKAVPR